MDYDAAIKRARTPRKLVWHYTTLDTLALILQSNSLHATEVSFQNDIRETSTADSVFGTVLKDMCSEDQYRQFGREALRFLDDGDTWQPLPGMISHQLTRNARFIVCASSDPDSLYAWRTYSEGGISCAIGLDPDVALGVVDPDRNKGRHRVHHWREVVYLPGQIQDEAERVLKQLGDRWLSAKKEGGPEEGGNAANVVMIENLTAARSRLRAIAKDASFSDEHEQRVTVEAVSLKALVTTTSSMGPRPQIKLVASELGRWGEQYHAASHAPKLPIRGIRLGPDAPESAITSTQWLLLANGYLIDPYYDDAAGQPGPFTPLTWKETVVIDRSVHPYRSR